MANDILNPMEALEARISDLAEAVSQGFAGMNDRFESIDKRLGGIDGRLNGIDERLDKVDKRLEILDEKVDEVLRATAEGFLEIRDNMTGLATKDDLDVAVAGIQHHIDARRNEHHILAGRISDLENIARNRGAID